MISLESRMVASDAVVSADLAGETVMLSLRTELYYALDPVGARVWDLLQEPRTLASVRDALLAEYDVDAERCGRDLLALVADLARHELVEAAPAEGAQV